MVTNHPLCRRTHKPLSHEATAEHDHPTLYTTLALTRPAIQHTQRDVSRCVASGEGGIRTLGRLAPTPVFETGPIGHSGTSPKPLFPGRFCHIGFPCLPACTTV